MNVSAMDELNLDDLFDGNGEGHSLFDEDDLVNEFGGENGKNKFDLEMSEMKWVDPALANMAPVEGVAAESAMPAFPEIPLPDQPPKKKEKKKKKKEKYKTEQRQRGQEAPVQDPFDRMIVDPPMLQPQGEKVLNKISKQKGSKKKKSKKNKSSPTPGGISSPHLDDKQAVTKDSRHKHQTLPQSRPPPEVVSPSSTSLESPNLSADVSPHLGAQTQKLPRGKRSSSLDSTKSTKRKKERQDSFRSIQSSSSTSDQFPHHQITNESKKQSKRRKKDKPNDFFSPNQMQMPMQMQPQMQMQMQMQPQMQMQIQMQPQMSMSMPPNQQRDHRAFANGGNMVSSTNQKQPNVEPNFYSSLGSLSSLNPSMRQPNSSNNSHFPIPTLQNLDLSIDYANSGGQIKNSKSNSLESDQEKKNLLYQLYADGFRAGAKLNPDVPDKKLGQVGESGAASAFALRNLVAEKNVNLIAQNKKNAKSKTKVAGASALQNDSMPMIEQGSKTNVQNNGLVMNEMTKRRKSRNLTSQDDESHSQASSKGSMSEASKLFATGFKQHSTGNILVMNLKLRIDGRIKDYSNGLKNLVAHVSLPSEGVNNVTTKVTGTQLQNTNKSRSALNRMSSKNNTKASTSSLVKYSDSSSIKSKKRKNGLNLNKNAFKTKKVRKPIKLTSSNIIPYLLDPWNNFTSLQRRQKLFNFMSSKFTSLKSDQNSKEKSRKLAFQKKRDKLNELSNSAEEVSTVNMWTFVDQANYFSEVRDEDAMEELQKVWQPERIEEGSAYWGESPPVSLITEKRHCVKDDSISLFDRLQSLLIVKDEDDSNDEKEENDDFGPASDSSSSLFPLRGIDVHESERNSVLHDPTEGTKIPNRYTNSDDVDVSNLSLDQRTFIHLRALHLVDRPYLPHTRPVAIEDDCDDDDELNSCSSHDEDSDLSYDHSDDHLFSHIHSLRTRLSEINHVNNICTANLQATVKQNLSKVLLEKKQGEEAILAKYSLKKNKTSV